MQLIGIVAHLNVAKYLVEQCRCVPVAALNYSGDGPPPTKRAQKIDTRTIAHNFWYNYNRGFGVCQATAHNDPMSDPSFRAIYCAGSCPVLPVVFLPSVIVVGRFCYKAKVNNDNAPRPQRTASRQNDDYSRERLVCVRVLEKKNASHRRWFGSVHGGGAWAFTLSKHKKLDYATLTKVNESST
jgi:hypothetical protein